MPWGRLPVNFLREQANGDSVSLLVHVQPKASRTRLAGLHGAAIKLCITEPPVEGKANAAAIRFFADLFKLPKAAVSIAAGETSRDKRLVITGISITKAEEVLFPLLAS